MLFRSMAILDFCQRIENCSKCQHKECRFFCISGVDAVSFNMEFSCIRETSNYFYKWQVGNGEGYMAEAVWKKDGFCLKNIKEIG